MGNMDKYEEWERTGCLEQKLKLIKELVSKKVIIRDIAKCVGIGERCLLRMKAKHERIRQAFIFGDYELKDKLINAIYKRAVGMEVEETTTTVEESKGVKKKKITKTSKIVPPDYNSARYLLITKFGRENNEKKDEIDIMEKRLEKDNEEWN
jgi:predicted DNA-binding transcriptional regulator YafY